jgi:transposase
MRYIGFDIHKGYTYFSEMAEDGAVVDRGRVANTQEAFTSLLAHRTEPVRAALESTFNWYYLYDLIQPLVNDLTLVHPGKLCAFRIERTKTDRRSSDLLAQLTRLDMLPVAYVPPREIRDLREILRYRAALVKIDTMLKNRVRSILHRTGVELTHTRVFGKLAQAALAAHPVREPYRLLLDGYRAVHTTVEEQIKHVTQHIDAIAEITPEAHRLMTVPQVKYYTALLIWAELGDISRFPSAKHLASYAGITPSLFQSGESTRRGAITRQGSPWLRWILIETAHRLIRSSPRFRRFYARVAKRKGGKVAITAVAHKLLHIAYYMLKNGVDYEERNCG